MELASVELHEIQQRTQLAQEHLDGAWIYATGMTGPFGYWLISALEHLRTSAGVRVRLDLLSREPSAFLARYPGFRQHDWLQVYAGDVRTFSLPSNPYSHVITAAATTASETFHGQMPGLKFSTVVEGTQQVLGALNPSRECRVLLVSSGSTCGTTLLAPEQKIPEAWPEAPPLVPGAVLGHAKRAAEVVALCHAEETPRHTVSILRCFSFSGPAMPMNLHYAIGNFVEAAVTGRSIVIRSDGSAVRSYMHMGDMTAWLLQALAIAPAGQVLNFGSEVALSVLELAEVVKRVTGSGAPIEVLGDKEGSPPTSAAPYYVPSTAITRAHLSVNEWTSLEESIRRWINFLHS